jgi:hypothetical protein
MKRIHNTVRYIDSSNKRLNRSQKSIGSIPQLRSIGRTAAGSAAEDAARTTRKSKSCFFEEQLRQIEAARVLSR